MLLAFAVVGLFVCVFPFVNDVLWIPTLSLVALDSR